MLIGIIMRTLHYSSADKGIEKGTSSSYYCTRGERHFGALLRRSVLGVECMVDLAWNLASAILIRFTLT